MSEPARARKKLWYFATPYSVKWNLVGLRNYRAQEANFRRACVQAGELVAAGYVIFSPICHSHPIQCAHPAIPDEAWYDFDNALIDATDWAGIILAPGWWQSEGCCAERERFEARGLPILTLKEALEIPDG